jgi:hypothetical protein
MGQSFGDHLVIRPNAGFQKCQQSQAGQPTLEASNPTVQNMLPVAVLLGALEIVDGSGNGCLNISVEPFSGLLFSGGWLGGGPEEQLPEPKCMAQFD